jgi:hypothetical protein
MIECVATVRVEVLTFAVPPARVTVPRLALPFLNVTVPVGVPPEADVTAAVKVTFWPKLEGFTSDNSVVVVANFPTTWVSAGDVLVRNPVSPGYFAVMECEPTARDDVVKVALPPASGAVPKVAAPFLNVTSSPSGGVPEPALAVAVKVTCCPSSLGFNEEATTVVVADLLTVCVSTAEVLVRNAVSPGYFALIERVPAGSEDVASVATPLVNVPVPKVVDPFVKVMVSPSAGVPSLELTVAVNVTD